MRKTKRLARKIDAKDTQIAALTKDLKSKEKEIEELNAEKEKLEEDVSDFEDEIDDLKTEVKSLNRKEPPPSTSTLREEMLNELIKDNWVLLTNCLEEFEKWVDLKK